MLEKVRKPGRAKNIVAYIIFGVICLVFVFFGVAPDQMGFMSGGGSAASVNGDLISIADWQDRTRQIESQYSGQLDAFPAAQRQMFTSRLRASALEDLINSEVVVQASKSQRLFVPDLAVRDYIVNIPAFQDNGRFVRDRYQNYLTNSSMRASEFEGKVKKDLAASRLQNIFSDAFQPSLAMIENYKMSQEYEVNLAFIQIDAEKLAEGYKPTAKDIQVYIKDNSAKISEYYKSNQKNYLIPEQVRVRHILFRFPEGKKDGEGELKKAQDLKAKLNPDNFAKFARDLSDDVASKEKGGDLGFIERNQMVAEFEEVAFSQKKGVISEPVKTEFGYHLILVEERKAGMEKELASVQEEIAKTLLVTGKKDDLKAQLDKFAGTPSELTQLMANYSLKWDETGYFKVDSRQIPKLGEDDGIVSEALKLEKVNQVVPKIVNQAGSQYIVRLAGTKKSKAPSQSKDEELKRSLSNRAANQVFTSWIQSYKDTLKINRNTQLIQ